MDFVDLLEISAEDDGLTGDEFEFYEHVEDDEALLTVADQEVVLDEVKGLLIDWVIVVVLRILHLERRPLHLKICFKFLQLFFNLTLHCDANAEFFGRGDPFFTDQKAKLLNVLSVSKLILELKVDEKHPRQTV